MSIKKITDDIKKLTREFEFDSEAQDWIDKIMDSETENYVPPDDTYKPKMSVEAYNIVAGLVADTHYHAENNLHDRLYGFHNFEGFIKILKKRKNPKIFKHHVDANNKCFCGKKITTFMCYYIDVLTLEVASKHVDSLFTFCDCGSMLKYEAISINPLILKIIGRHNTKSI